jgi:hypothetical protein
MSETTSQAPAPGQEQDAPAAPETEATAPAEHGAETEQQDDGERKHLDRVDRRIARLTARMSAAVRETEQLRYQLQQAQARPNGEPGQLDEAVVQKLRAQWDAEQAAKAANERKEQFHAQGEKEFRDWRERCDSLIAMGADDQIAQLLVEMDDGIRVVAALADDPEELERIAGLKSERARAIALGKYAERLKAKPADPQRGVSRAPAPIRPVNGRAAPVFNEYEATTEQLVDFYAKQAMERARSLNRR